MDRKIKPSDIQEFCEEAIRRGVLNYSEAVEWFYKLADAAKSLFPEARQYRYRWEA